MTRDQSRLCARCVAFALGMVAYAANPPSINYFPLEYAWRPGYVPGLPSVDWYGRILWVLIVVLFTLPVARFVIFRARKEALADESAERVSRIVWITLSVVVCAAAVSVWRALTG